MKAQNIGILGATGAVGREMLQLLEEYGLNVGELRLLASARSAGQVLPFRGRELVVEEAREGSFDGLDYVLGAVGAEISRHEAPAVTAAGAVYIDNSSAFRLCEGVPLVVPEINGADAFRNRGIVANPNCSTVITLMAVAALHARSPIESVRICTYQAVSGAGQRGLEELHGQMKALAEGRAAEHKVFARQIACNLIPCIGTETENGYTDEEMKLQREARRILHAPALRASCTCVRVGVERSHAIAVSVRTREAIGAAEAKAAIGAFPGVRLVEDGVPTPLQSSGQDLVLVGRVRADSCDERTLDLFCCGDQLRKGAAANAVQILRLLSEGKE